MLFALPVALLMLVLCWLWLQLFYNTKESEWSALIPSLDIRCSRLFQWRVDKDVQAVQAHLKAMLVKQYKDLGRPK